MPDPIVLTPIRVTAFHRNKKVPGWGLKAVAVGALAIILAGCPDDDDPLISSTDDEEVSGDEGAPDEISAGDEIPTNSAGQEPNAETINEEADNSSGAADDPPPDEAVTTGELEILDIDGFVRDDGFTVVASFNQMIFDQSVYFVSMELRVDNSEADITILYSQTDGEVVVDTINRETGNPFPLTNSISTSADTVTVDGTYPPEWPVDPDNDKYRMTIRFRSTPTEVPFSVDSGERSFQAEQ